MATRSKNQIANRSSRESCNKNGVPKAINTDNGIMFTRNKFEEAARRNGLLALPNCQTVYLQSGTKLRQNCYSGKYRRPGDTDRKPTISS